MPDQENTAFSPGAFSLAGQVALVTGAGRGIGRSCSLALAQAGARVIAVARSRAELETLQAGNPQSIQAWPEDIRATSFFERLGQLEHLDILVHNVGINRPQPFVEVEPEALDQMLELNIRSAFLVAQAAARIMMAQGRGSIIHMSSQMGHVGSPNRTVYCMTKHAIEGLTKAMAVELAPCGIRVNAVAPTFVRTQMTAPMLDDPAFSKEVLERIPMGRLGLTSEVANAVLFLASPAAALITGDSLKVDGGWTAQ